MSIERNKTSETLRLNQQQITLLAAVLERSPQPFAAGYTDGRLHVANAAYSMLTGYSKEELKKIDWPRALAHPQWQEIERKELEKLTLTGRPVRYETEYIRKNVIPEFERL